MVSSASNIDTCLYIWRLPVALSWSYKVRGPSLRPGSSSTRHQPGCLRYLYQGWTYHHDFSVILLKPCCGCSSGPHDTLFMVVCIMSFDCETTGRDDMCNPDLLTSSQTVDAVLEYIGCGDMCPSYLAFLFHFHDRRLLIEWCYWIPTTVVDNCRNEELLFRREWTLPAIA